MTAAFYRMLSFFRHERSVDISRSLQAAYTARRSLQYNSTLRCTCIPDLNHSLNDSHISNLLQHCFQGVAKQSSVPRAMLSLDGYPDYMKVDTGYVEPSM